MNSKILYFVGGVVAGSVATFIVTRRRMENRIQAEVDEVKKEYYARSSIGKVIEKEETDAGVKLTVKVDPHEIAKLNEQKKQDLIQNREIIQKQNYNLFSKPPHARDIHNGIDEGEDLEVGGVSDYPRDDLAEKPYTITPTQFVNECPFYDKVTLECYEDGIVANALTDEIIEDIDRDIGEDSLTKFGEFEEDVVYVRNERTSTDYEVIRQHRPFARFPDDE